MKIFTGPFIEDVTASRKMSKRSVILLIVLLCYLSIMPQYVQWQKISMSKARPYNCRKFHKIVLFFSQKISSRIASQAK